MARVGDRAFRTDGLRSATVHACTELGRDVFGDDAMVTTIRGRRDAVRSGEGILSRLKRRT